MIQYTPNKLHSSCQNELQNKNKQRRSKAAVTASHLCRNVLLNILFSNTLHILVRSAVIGTNHISFYHKTASKIRGSFILIFMF